MMLVKAVAGWNNMVNHISDRIYLWHDKHWAQCKEIDMWQVLHKGMIIKSSMTRQVNERTIFRAGNVVVKSFYIDFYAFDFKPCEALIDCRAVIADLSCHWLIVVPWLAVFEITFWKAWLLDCRRSFDPRTTRKRRQEFWEILWGGYLCEQESWSGSEVCWLLCFVKVQS